MPATERSSESIFSSSCDILLDRDREGIDRVRSSPFGGHRFFGSETDIVLFHLRRGLGNFDRVRGRGFDSSARQIFGGGESPGAVGDHAHAHAERFRVGGAADFAIFRGERAAALADHARIGIGRAAQRCGIQSPVGDIVHAEI